MIYMAKEIGGKMNVHQLENGGIKYGIFTPWNVTRPLKRITAILIDLEGYIVLNEKSKVEEESVPMIPFL